MDNASAWGALGAGLSTLGEGLNAMQLRKLAEAQRKREEDRQKEQDALEKAIAQANAAKGMRAENFTLSQKAGIGTNSPDAMKAILNRAAMNTGGEETVDPVSGDTYYRAPGDSPNDQKVAMETARREAAQAQLQERLAAAAELNRLKLDNDRYKHDSESANNAANNKSRVVVVGMQQEGQDRRFGGVSGNTKYVQDRADTRAEMAAGARGSKAPTESQSKDHTYYGLMAGAQKTLDELSSSVRPDRISAAIRLPEMIANRGLSKQEQLYMRAARDLAAAVYRKESGAAVAPREIADVFNRYITMGGDTPEAIAAKTEARTRRLEDQRLKALPAIRYYEALGDYSTQPGQKAPRANSGLSNLNSMGRP